MAVQAQQYPTNATAFQPEYRNRGQQALPQGLVSPAPNNLVEYQQLQSAANQLRLLGLEFNSIQQSVLKGQVNENKADDVAARNLLGPRKRSRELIDTSDHQRHQQLIKVPEFLHCPQGTSGATVIPQQFGAVSTGLQLGVGNKGHYASAAAGAGFENSTVFSALGGEVLLQLQQQRNEIDQYLRLQEEKVRQMLAEKTQQHSRVLLGAIERFMARCLKERALKVEDVNRRNKELEEKLKQLTLETRMWQKQARDYEGLVTTLRNNLQVVALSREQSREGCGDSEADNNSVCSYHDDAHARMCMENKELKEQRTCRMCRSNDVCILLLPCQHLCLCKDCETRSDACPICHTAKDASFQVFMA